MQASTQSPNLRTASRPDWHIPAALIALTLIPMAGGLVRLVSFANYAPITPENARFATAPMPVIVHIIGATLFCLLGAFQFAAGFRRRNPTWHRLAGRLLIICGFAASLSGLWMTQFYAVPRELQGDLLYGVRLLVGVGMTGALGLGLAAILRRDVQTHRNWLMRAYALGQGAGTQALIMLPFTLLFGAPLGLPRDILMSLAWAFNLAVVEWLIRRRRGQGRAIAQQSASAASHTTSPLR